MNVAAINAQPRLKVVHTAKPYQSITSILKTYILLDIRLFSDLFHLYIGKILIIGLFFDPILHFLATFYFTYTIRYNQKSE